LKFLLISRRLDNKLSAPKCNYNLALALARLGADVQILTSIISIPSKDLNKLGEAGVKIKKAPKVFASRAISPLFYAFFAEANKEDRVIIGNGYTLRDDITWIHYLRLGVLTYLLDFLSDGEKRKAHIESHIEKAIFKSSEKLWAVSNLVRRLLIKEYGVPENKVFVLHNGVDTEKYYPLNGQEKSELRKRLNIPEDAKVMIFVGGDPLRKGFGRILYALKKLEEAGGGNYVLLAIGFKPTSDIVNLSSGLKVRFMGNVPEENLINFYQASDLLLLPSYFDPFSLVVLEAMACGAVPIVTPVVGASEIIIHGKNGFIVTDESDLAKTLLELAEFDLEKLQKEAIATARAHSWINIAKGLQREIKGGRP
jgi:glycosyltransferase involved in cell wall biosynthesis